MGALVGVVRKESARRTASTGVGGQVCSKGSRRRGAVVLRDGESAPIPTFPRFAEEGAEPVLLVKSRRFSQQPVYPFLRVAGEGRDGGRLLLSRRA